MTGSEQQREKDKVAAIMLAKQKAGTYPCFSVRSNMADMLRALANLFISSFGEEGGGRSRCSSEMSD